MRSAKIGNFLPLLSSLPFSAWAVLFAITYSGLIWLNFSISTSLLPFFSIFLPGGILAASLLLTRHDRWGWFLILGLAINLFTGWQFDLPFRLNLAFSLVHLGVNRSKVL